MSKLYNTASETFKIGLETVFGTPTTPTKSLKHSGATADIAYSTVEDPSFTGTRATAGSSYVGETVNISWPWVANNDNLGYALALTNGAETLVPASAGAATHRIFMKDSSDLPSATIETSVGGVFTYTNSGCVAKASSFEITPKAIITGKTDFIGIKQVEKATATPLTIANSRNFTFNDTRSGAIEIEGAVVGYVKNMKFAIDNGVSSDDYTMGSEGKLSSLPAGKRKFTGSMTMKFNEDSKDLLNYIRQSKIFDMKVTIDSGVTVGASDTYKLVIFLNAVQFSNLKNENGEFAYFTGDWTVVGDSAYFELTDDRLTSYLL